MARQQRSSSVYDISPKRNDKTGLFHKKIVLSGKQLTYGVILGVCLTLITIALQCVAFLTPHWKEVSPNNHLLYVDGIDALIRHEVLVYFNSVHRFTHHSYGLFHRCEYHLSNASKLLKEQEAYLHRSLKRQHKTCTKNFLPSYEDEQFNECHSLQYYRFCSKTSEKNFDIYNDYLRAMFDILSEPRKSPDSPSSCDCHYPPYVIVCIVLGILVLIFLVLTAVLFGIFPFVKKQHRLKVKCFGVLSSILSSVFLLINLLVILSHLNYESIEYLIAIERHYRASQIYKLSLDMKAVIDQFIPSLNIRIGYSTRLAWLAFGLSIIDGILLMLTCNITHDTDDVHEEFTAIPSDPSEQSNNVQPEKDQKATTPLTTTAQQTNEPVDRSSSSVSFHSLSTVPTIVVDNVDEQSRPSSYKPPSCLKRSSTGRTHFEDEV